MGSSVPASLGGRFPPLPRRHRLRVAPQPTLGIPSLLLQIPQHRLPACVPLIPPCEAGAAKLLVQVAAIGQDDLGHRPFVAVYVADLYRHHVSESQIPGELLCPRPEWLLHLGAVDPPQPDAL